MSPFLRKSPFSFRQLCLLAMGVAVPLVAHAQNGDLWPTYQGSSHRNAWTQHGLEVKRLTTAWNWRSETPPETAWHGPAKWDAYAGIRGLHSMRNYDPAYHPIAAEGSVYFGTTSDDSVYCLDAKSGKVRWRFTAGGPVRVAPSYEEERVYFGSDDGWAYCLNASDGELVWKHSPKPKARKLLHNGRLISPWPVRTGVTVLDGVAYYAASLLPWKSSYLVAVDATTGRVTTESHFAHELNNATFEGPLVVSPERIVAPQGRVAPMLFDRATGKAQGSLKGGGGSFVVLTPDSQLIHGPGNKTGWLTASRPLNREAIATFKQGNAIVVAGDISFMVTDDELVASNWVARKPMWKQPCQGAYALLVAGDHVFVGKRDEIQIYAAATGRLERTLASRGRVYGLAAAEGGLIVSTDEGLVTRFSEAPVEIRTSPQATPPNVASAEKSLSPPADFREPGLRSRWVFQRPHADQRQVRDLAGSLHASVRAPSRFANLGDVEAFELNGEATIVVADDHRKANLPRQLLTVEAWVRLDKAQTWGGILGAIQDNGSYERGWLLGFRDKRFSFAVASESAKKLTYLTDSAERKLGQWRHVAGVYDGQSMKLYVDGKLAATSDEQKGDILYAPTSVFEIGAYHDDNEYYRMQGAVHEVRLYDRALSAEQIAKHAQSKSIAEPSYQKVAVGPYLQFTSHDTATVRWRTSEPCRSQLHIEGVQVEQSNSKGREHEATLKGLRRRDLYKFHIDFVEKGTPRRTPAYECDNFFNFAPKTRRPLTNPKLGPLSQAVQALIPDGGLGVAIEPTPEQLRELLTIPATRWIVFHEDADLLASQRRWLIEAGQYGGKASVLPYQADSNSIEATSAFADVVVYDAAFEAGEAKRLVRPGGSALAWDSTQETPTLPAWRRPRIQGAGDWTHLYGSADNSAFGGESLSGVSRTDELAVQWIGRPGPRYQPDRSGRKPSPLAANGRLFLQGLERVVAVNSFNGRVLWSMELPHLGRFNMPRDCSNWCIDQDAVFLANRDKLWRLDGATGNVDAIWDAAEKAGLDPEAGKWDWGFVGRKKDWLIGSAVKAETVFTDYWGNANQGWYDAKSGEATHKICSDRLFVLSPDKGKTLWNRDGLIVNSTITIAGDRIYFAESQQPSLKQAATRRVGPELFAKGLRMVCLDLATGNEVWTEPIEGLDGEVVFYLAHSQDRLALVGSGKKSYEVRVLDAKSGAIKWRRQAPWPSDNHGGHMSRPAIVGGVLYVRPHVFELESGLGLSLRMPGGGCGTYAATTDMLVFRSRNVTMWNRKEGGATAWNRLRPDCWLSTIPADGLLLSPEGGGGCSCGSWMETSIGFIPNTLLPRKSKPTKTE